MGRRGRMEAARNEVKEEEKIVHGNFRASELDKMSPGLSPKVRV
jgi:hypothetical protein